VGKHHLLCLDKLPPAISTTSITSSIPHARCRREHECREAQAGLNLTQTNRIEGHRAQRTPQSSLRAAENTSSASDTAQHCGAANCLEAGQARNSTPRQVGGRQQPRDACQGGLHAATPANTATCKTTSNVRKANRANSIASVQVPRREHRSDKQPVKR
jgi:hypothetical protein